MANGIEKERALVAALAEYFSLETRRSWDRDYGIDVLIRGLISPPIARTPLAVQLTWNRGNWNKRAMTFEKATSIAERVVFLEINSRDVNELLVAGVRTVLAQLIMDAGAPTHAIVEINQDGRYRISDMEVRLADFRKKLEETIDGDIIGYLTYWNGDIGFADVTIGDETITFFCNRRNTEQKTIDRLAGCSGQIETRDQPRVVFTDGGVNRNSEYRKFALGMHLV